MPSCVKALRWFRRSLAFLPSEAHVRRLVRRRIRARKRHRRQEEIVCCETVYAHGTCSPKKRFHCRIQFRCAASQLEAFLPLACVQCDLATSRLHASHPSCAIIYDSFRCRIVVTWNDRAVRRHRLNHLRIALPSCDTERMECNQHYCRCRLSGQQHIFPPHSDPAFDYGSKGPKGWGRMVGGVETGL